MNSQKDLFFDSEGDAWFERNLGESSAKAEPIAEALKELGAAPQRVLEIGCASGDRLAALKKIFSAESHGVDPSRKAIEQGRKVHPDLFLERGAADELRFPDNHFDVVIFGFCLYLCDPHDYFRIAWQADRVLRDKGFLVIKDFSSPAPYRVSYTYRPGVYSHKMDWSKMFAWNPAYRVLSRRYLEHQIPFTFEPNERISIDLLRKDQVGAFPDQSI